MMSVMEEYDSTYIVKCIERRFKNVAKLKGDFSLMPMPKENHLQVVTNKEKSDTFGEVFTPIWLVDEMLQRVSDYDWKNQNLIYSLRKFQNS